MGNVTIPQRYIEISGCIVCIYACFWEPLDNMSNTQFDIYTLGFCKHLATLTLITCPSPGKNLCWETTRTWLRPGTLTTYMFVYIHMPHEAWRVLLTEDPRKEKTANEVALFLGQYLVYGMCFCWHCCCCYRRRLLFRTKWPWLWLLLSSSPVGGLTTLESCTQLLPFCLLLLLLLLVGMVADCWLLIVDCLLIVYIPFNPWISKD